jgi:uncharacterized protein (DUF488 family)
MHTLYDLSYLEITDLDILDQLVNALDAVLIDVRYSPNSRNPQWRKKAIERKLGFRYFNLKALGNIHYRGGPIEFVDLQEGIATLARFLQSKNVIIMCVCSRREICHRVKIAELFKQEYGQECIPLTPKLVNEIITSTITKSISDLQLPLF